MAESGFVCSLLTASPRSSIRHKCRPRSPPPNIRLVCPFFIHILVLLPPFFVCVCLCFILLFYDLHNDYSLHSFGAFFFFFFFFFSFLLPVLKGCRKDAEHSEHLRLKVAPYIKLVVLRGALLIIHDNRRNMFF